MRTVLSLVTMLVFAHADAGVAGARVWAMPADVVRVEQAIADAVRARMGDQADVEVAQLEMACEHDYVYLQAVPEPDARMGQRVYFRLLGSDGRGGAPRPAGSASAVVSVAVPHVRARALVPRGRELREGDIERTQAPIVGMPLRRLPTLAEVAGARTLVNLAPGEVLTRTTVAARPAVKSGQVVRATARVGGLEVTALLVAAQDGAPGSVIRVVNKESRRELRARVIEPGIVEVIP